MMFRLCCILKLNVMIALIVNYNKCHDFFCLCLHVYVCIQMHVHVVSLQVTLLLKPQYTPAVRYIWLQIKAYGHQRGHCGHMHSLGKDHTHCVSPANKNVLCHWFAQAVSILHSLLCSFIYLQDWYQFHIWETVNYTVADDGIHTSIVYTICTGIQLKLTPTYIQAVAVCASCNFRSR